MVAIDVKRIQYEMAKSKMTYSELADRSGLNRMTISGVIHKGTCRPDNVGKIAEALDIDPLEIMA